MTEYGSVLYVLGLVLVEIRAAEGLDRARALADIVHNVPADIASGKPEAEIIQHVMYRAERLGIERTASEYFSLAHRHLSGKG